MAGGRPLFSHPLMNWCYLAVRRAEGIVTAASPPAGTSLLSDYVWIQILYFMLTIGRGPARPQPGETARRPSRVGDPATAICQQQFKCGAGPVAVVSIGFSRFYRAERARCAAGGGGIPGRARVWCCGRGGASRVVDYAYRRAPLLRKIETNFCQMQALLRCLFVLKCQEYTIKQV